MSQWVQLLQDPSTDGDGVVIHANILAIDIAKKVMLSQKTRLTPLSEFEKSYLLVSTTVGSRFLPITLSQIFGILWTLWHDLWGK